MTACESEKYQDSLKTFENQNRKLFLFGYFNILIVVVSWVFIALNAGLFQKWIMIHGHSEKEIIDRIGVIKVQTPQEAHLLGIIKVLVRLQIVMLKVFVVRTVQNIMMIIGVITLGFARYQARVLRVMREKTEVK